MGAPCASRPRDFAFDGFHFRFLGAITTPNVLLHYRLGQSFRSLEAELLEQIEAVRFVQVPVPMIFAYLPAPAFG